jgi:hypothetical protein
LHGSKVRWLTNSVSDGSLRLCHLVKRWDPERLVAESLCAVLFVSPVSPEILKPGSPLQRGHPVLVDRAREHADPHPYMDKDPVSRVEWDPRGKYAGVEFRWFALGVNKIVIG